MRHIIFICTSNFDRSVSLERYFKSVYPNNEYRSAGVNRYFTGLKGTHYLTQEDIDWADLIVYAEDIHYKVVRRDFDMTKKEMSDKDTCILNLGEYTQGQVGEDYLLKAEFILKKTIEMNAEQKRRIELLNNCELQVGADEKFVREFFLKRNDEAELTKKQSDKINELIRKYRFQIGRK